MRLLTSCLCRDGHLSKLCLQPRFVMRLLTSWFFAEMVPVSWSLCLRRAFGSLMHHVSTSPGFCTSLHTSFRPTTSGPCRTARACSARHTDLPCLQVGTTICSARVFVAMSLVQTVIKIHCHQVARSCGAHCLLCCRTVLYCTLLTNSAHAITLTLGLERIALLLL